MVAALARLRSAGERITPARHAVLRVLDVADPCDEHLSAEQIGERVAVLEPSIHRATVYRTLTALTDAAVLSHVHLGGSGTVYHLASPPAEPTQPTRDDGAHAHVQCVSCGRVLDVPSHTFDDLAGRLEADLGFAVDTSHAALLGRCADCRLPRPEVRP